MRGIVVIYILFFMLSVSACSEQGCDPTRNNIVSIGFFTTTKTAASIEHEFIYVDSKSYLIYKDTTLSIAHIPLPYDKDSAIIVFKNITTKTIGGAPIKFIKIDTLCLHYRRTFYLVSPTCEYDMKVSDLQVTSTTFLKTEVDLPNILIDATNPQIHIKIYN